MVVADEAVAGEQRAVVFDFGIAKLAAEHRHPTAQADLTDLRIAIGTATYMAPEQAAGGTTLSAAVDVYALGIMLYEMACGAPPFSASSYALLLDMHRYSQPLPLEKVVPGLPAALTSLVARMLAKEAAQRPSMADVRLALAAILPGLAETSPDATDRPSQTPALSAAASKPPLAGQPPLAEADDQRSPALRATDLADADQRAAPPTRRRRNTETLPQRRDSATLPLARLLAGEETLPPTRLVGNARAGESTPRPTAAQLLESETVPLSRTDADGPADAGLDADETRPPLRPARPRSGGAELPSWLWLALALALFWGGFLLRGCSPTG